MYVHIPFYVIAMIKGKIQIKMWYIYDEKRNKTFYNTVLKKFSYIKIKQMMTEQIFQCRVIKGIVNNQSTRSRKMFQ